MTYLSNTCVDT